MAANDFTIDRYVDSTMEVYRRVIYDHTKPVNTTREMELLAEQLYR